MSRPSRFDADFRLHAVELVGLSRKPKARIAADLGVSATTLSKWMDANKKKTGDPDVLTRSEREELLALRVEKREWILEREILKKAMAFWVKESKT